MEGPVESAIRNFRRVYERIANLEEAQKSLRTRARGFPSLMMQMGLPASLTFLAAKAEEGYVKAAIDLLQGESVEDDEKLGYALYLLLVLWRIESFTGAKLTARLPEGMGEVIEEVGEKSRFLERMLVPYLLQVKYLSEAMLKGE